MTLKKLLLVSTIIMVCIFGGTVSAQTPPISSITPHKNDLNVAGNANIIVVFTTDMNASTINSQTFLVDGKTGGHMSGTVSYNAPTRTATFVPATGTQYRGGDLVTVELTNDIWTSLGGQAFPSGYTWTFFSAARGEPRMAKRGSYPISANAQTLSSANFNGGFPDLAVGYGFKSTSITVSLNDDRVRFPNYASYSVGQDPLGIYSNDLDLDGDMDVVSSSRWDNNGTVLLNSGAGIFAPQSPRWPSGAGPEAIATADFEGDGYPELAFANTQAGNVTFRLNYGNATFPIEDGPYPVGSMPRDIAVADVNGDGLLDVITANSNSNDISVLRNFGYLLFYSASSYATHNSPSSIFAGDLDGDADVDLAISNDVSNDVTVLLNDGTGNFSSRIDWVTGNTPTSICGGDFDGDGDLDLATSNWGDNNFSILYNTGTGSFGTRVNHPLAYAVAHMCAADLDWDRVIDFAIINNGQNKVWIMMPYICGDANNDNSVNVGDAVFIINYIFKGGPEPLPPAAADANGDLSINIGDAVYLNNYIFYGGPPPICNDGMQLPKPGPVGASFGVRYENGKTFVEIDSKIDLAGVQFELAVPDGTPITKLISGIAHVVNYSEGTARVGLVDLEGNGIIPAGKTTLFEIAGRAEVISATGADLKGNSIEIQLSSVEKDGALPATFELGQNYPNPFNPSTEIRFSLPSASTVKLEVFDITGRLVTTVANGRFEAGSHSVIWNAGNTASGVYLYRMQAGSFVDSKKMMLLK